MKLSIYLIILSLFLNQPNVFASTSKNNTDLIRQSQKAAYSREKRYKNPPPIPKSFESNDLKPCAMTTLFTCMMLFATVVDVQNTIQKETRQMHKSDKSAPSRSKICEIKSQNKALQKIDSAVKSLTPAIETASLHPDTSQEVCTISSANHQLVSQPAPKDAVCLNAVKPGTILQMPIQQLHPSQPAVGHQLVGQLFSTVANESPDAFQAQLDQLTFPSVISPNGTVYISDGHHRTTTATLKEIYNNTPGRYQIKIDIKDNYMGSSWSQFITKMIDQNKMYFPSPAMEELKTAVSKANPSEQEIIYHRFLDKYLPPSFAAFPDNPLRSEIQTVMTELNLPSDHRENYFEFRVAEAVQNVLNASNTPLTQETCPSQVKNWSCSQVSSMRSQIIGVMAHPDVEQAIRENVTEGLCKNSLGQTKECKDAYIDNIHASLHVVPNHMSTASQK